ncbi:hypothetical protein IPJ72_03380 [Candidatus Peregrinibacteria bacterium]|nr:MAG: hypothetical protein IPJ72_03380 [Candidatus Peregrinibacteria bacterium]
MNETKLKHKTGSIELSAATAEDIREKLGSEPGFISPVGIKQKKQADVELIIVADDSLRTVKNMYGGNNAKHQDLLNVNIDRDYQADIEGDIAMAQAGYKSLDGKELKEDRGIEVGNIFQLGTHYSNKMKRAEFTDQDGQAKPYYMGCYGIGVGRTMGTIIEVHHDEKGMIWPKNIAPYQVHLVSIGDCQTQSDTLYQELTNAGIEVLYDDRNERPGIKLNDADLIGIPVRIVISPRTLENGELEWKVRTDTDAERIKQGNAVEKVREFYGINS